MPRTLETLSALPYGERNSRTHAKTPATKLAFQIQLNDYAQLLRQKSGGVTKTGQPGATPSEWAAK